MGIAGLDTAIILNEKFSMDARVIQREDRLRYARA